MRRNTKHKVMSVAMLGLAALSGCGGGDESSSGPSSSGSTSSSSSGASCNYPDKISSSERSQANACGIQISGNFAQADSGLASVIAACQQGKKTIADDYYAGTYTDMVNYARNVSSALSCGTSTAPALPNTSSQTYYNFCAQSTVSSGKITWLGSCFGPVRQGEGGCGTGGYSYITQYGSSATCTSSGQAWLNSK